MTVGSILHDVMLELDEDPSELSEYERRFMRYLNIGYQTAVRQYMKPREVYHFNTNKDGEANIAGMHIVRVVEAKRTKDGRDIRFALSGGGKLLETGEKDAEITLLCEVEYPELTMITEEPKLPEWAHHALVDYICFRHLSSGNLAKQSRAQFYKNAFYETVGQLRPQGMGSVTGYRNFYEATEA